MQEVELNDKMLERRDRIDNATYRLFQELLDLSDEEVEKVYPWNIADIELLQGYAISILNGKKLYVCTPFVTTKDGRQYRCTLSECFCKECKCQDEFMEKERILCCIESSLNREGLEITGITEDSISIRESTSASDFKISIAKIGRKG